MTREGLRTLVFGRRKPSVAACENFKARHHAASVRLEGRNEAMAVVVSDTLERDLELLGLTGVEDKLQDDVRGTLELLRNAGIKIWMLTGNKIETATVIAISAKLVTRNQHIHQHSRRRQTGAGLFTEQARLLSRHQHRIAPDHLCLNLFKNEFIEITTKLSAVVTCRCSQTQKADVPRLIRNFTKKRVCCIGDGGNDVSMIQAANVGVGIVGKEGRQASLAADFSVKLAQFVIHRGLLVHTLYCALYQGWLMVGYATIYTMAPVFSLVLDRDLNEDLALSYPELYKELTKDRHSAPAHLANLLWPVYVYSFVNLGRRFLLGTSIILQDILYMARD
ncbi:HAD-like domain-containing protein [Russula compacta]|nr:HAD-like domain-containing protein [Russula compacta]